MPIEHPSKQLHKKISGLISSSRFNEAFLLLKNGVKKFPSLDKELNKLKELENNYRYMLDYLADGNLDPSQNEMIAQMKDSLQRTNDLLVRESLLVDSPDFYSATKRLHNIRRSDFKAIWHGWKEAYNKDNNLNDLLDKEIISETNESENTSSETEMFLRQTDVPQINSPKISEHQSDLIEEMFTYLWTDAALNKEDLVEIIRFFENKEVPDYMKGLMISALTLANIQYFNPDFYEILIRVYENNDSRIIKSRGLTGILLIALIHSKRITGNIRLNSRLIMNSGDEDFKSVINDTLLDIIRTYDTKRVDDKMRNEVIPGLMKMGPELMEKMRNLSSDSEDFLSMENPDWEEMMENSEISDKIQEINEMQLEGADVMVTTFSQLKSFPFFNKASNWFMPFMEEHYLFKDFNIPGEEHPYKLIGNVMCDSDFHSFLLSMNNVGKERREQTLKMMQNQIKEVREAMTSGIGDDSENQKLKRKIRHTLQDLYRFFKYFKKKEDLRDPFGSPFMAENLSPLIKTLGLETDNLRVVSEFYFKNKYYDEAAGIFELIDSYSEGDFSVWEKIGFSHDKMKRFNEAAKWYHKAELINPGSEWLHNKLAITLKNAGRYKEALEYFSKALEKEPENYHLLMSTGQCLLENRQPKDALQYFYHAQYLKPDKIAPKRAVAWAELLSGNLEKAESQYEKILNDAKKDKTDVLNAAHAALASGNFKKALKLYKTFVELTENREITSLLLALRDDAETLRKLKIKTTDLRLIVDKIRYDLFD